MSVRQPAVQLALLGLVLAVAATAWVVSAAAPPRREIVLEAREMAFFLPGDPTRNPTLRLAPGETVRLTLVNRDLGRTHDLAVEAPGSFKGTTRPLTGDGASATLLLHAPPTPGEHTYLCTLHPRMMRGRLVIAPLP